MDSYAKRRIEMLRDSLMGLPPVYEMTWAEKLNYYCTLSRIDELKMEWQIIERGENDDLNE